MLSLGFLQDGHMAYLCKVSKYVGFFCLVSFILQVSTSVIPATTWGSRASQWAAGTPTATTSTASGLTSQISGLVNTSSRLGGRSY